mmetsp:Transcript_20812/g.37805  ORF Transcript_20812/g.37805 Transcript_20812/m.37805 type:complete len:135 (-) Transcript_20812:371-775(-)
MAIFLYMHQWLLLHGSTNKRTDLPLTLIQRVENEILPHKLVSSLFKQALDRHSLCVLGNSHGDDESSRKEIITEIPPPRELLLALDRFTRTMEKLLVELTTLETTYFIPVTKMDIFFFLSCHARSTLEFSMVLQ